MAAAMAAGKAAVAAVGKAAEAMAAGRAVLGQRPFLVSRSSCEPCGERGKP